MMQFKKYIDSPIGCIEVCTSSTALLSVAFVEAKLEDSPDAPIILDSACNQLLEYFAGDRQNFELTLSLQGTDFQKQVWKSLVAVPFGRTSTYKKQSQSLGNPKAIRAVGTANGRNPIAVVIPCHRIVGSDGSLTGYAGGLSRKDWLLKHELSQTEGAQQELF